MSSQLYEFVFRGWLAEEALDKAGRINRRSAANSEADFASILSLDLLDNGLVANARSMAVIYSAVAAFENSVRRLVAKVLLEQGGAGWWTSHVSEKIRTRAEARRKEEENVRWHAQRGSDLIYYISMGDLDSIIRQNAQHFVPHFLPSVEWATGVFEAIERSRNVIMHSGMLERADVERVGVFIRDWIKQVGA